MHSDLVASLSPLGPGMHGIDWGVVGLFLVVTTIVAFLVKGRQDSIRDFFLGGRNLPWVIVCLSLIATEISAASYIGVPYGVFKPGGSFTYLQLAIGAVVARFIIGYYIVPAYYEQETYSPYHYVGRKLGLGAERMTSILFMIGAILGQGVRVFAVAVVLQVITGVPMHLAIMIIAAFAALWAIVGGIRTVVWTDVVAFIVFVLAALAACVFLLWKTPGGVTAILEAADQKHKLTLLDFRLDLVIELTIWTGLFGSTFNSLASHGADQMNVQRLLCCRGEEPARHAIVWSSLSQVIVLLLMCIGLGLFYYYSAGLGSLRGFSEIAGGDRNVFPIFIATVLPAGLKGLLVIGLLAAAISSLDSTIAALSQTTVRAFFRDPKPGYAAGEKAHVHLSRFFIFFWSVVLCGTAVYVKSLTVFENLVTLALRTTSFTYGALLGALLLSLVLRHRDGRGILFASPLAVLAAFGITWHEAWAAWVLYIGMGAVVVCWFYTLFKETDLLARIENHDQYVRRAWYILLAEFPRTIWVFVGCGVVYYLHFGEFYKYFTGGEGELAWPWYLPMGIGITVSLGYLLAKPNTESNAERS